MIALLTKLWNDEDGALIATEYLMLGTIVTLGSVTGLASVRDSVNAEYEEYGNAVREVRQTHAVPARKAAGAGVGGSKAQAPQPGTQLLNQTPPLDGQTVAFSAQSP